ncbi:MAG: type II toxin-antitoxin system VapC family toxin [Nitrospirae bacterium]|nr:type II toxin-antitoxin system VapC family toxin [Nitrospirota bacterium]
MNYLLDTNMIVFRFDKNLIPQYQKVHKKFATLTNQDNLYISILTLYELEYSVFNADLSQRPFLQWMVDQTKAKFQVLPLTHSGARIYGELKSRLKEARNISRDNIKKHNIDVMLAGTAIKEGCILVSDDGIFKDICGINNKFLFENWLW